MKLIKLIDQGEKLAPTPQGKATRTGLRNMALSSLSFRLLALPVYLCLGFFVISWDYALLFFMSVNVLERNFVLISIVRKKKTIAANSVRTVTANTKTSVQ
mmetsp:Transcript_18606/g.20694  ORF Transcript_18606/g.20694 Transcript_18606/m.20694 type:complete len:101 (+) Transcript_18606:654-956(+)